MIPPVRMPIIRGLLVLAAVLCRPVRAADITVRLRPDAAPPGDRAAVDWVQRVVGLPRVEATPQVDGVLDEPLWDRALVAQDFRLLGSDRPASQQTTARIIFCPGTLCVGIVCEERNMDELVASVQQHDGPVWEDDCVELFVDANHDHRTYAQFVVNAAGTAMDARLSPTGDLYLEWNPHWERAVRRGQDRWSVEISIPLRVLGDRPGRVFGLNLAREERPHAELSSWMPQRDHFAYTIDELRRFADVGAEGTTMWLTGLSMGPILLGRNRISAVWRNSGENDAPAALALELASPEGDVMRAVADTVLVPAGEERALQVAVDVPQLRQGVWWLQVQALPVRDTDTESAVLARFPLFVDAVSPLAPPAMLTMGRDADLILNLLPLVAAPTLVSAKARISLETENGIDWHDTVSLSPLASPGSGSLIVTGTGIPFGQVTVSASVINADGTELGKSVRRRVTRLPGPLDRREPAGPVPNASFEEADRSGLPANWRCVWWAPGSADMESVPVHEFVSLEDDVAFHGRRSLRIGSTRDGRAPANEVLYARSARLPIEPGVSHRLTTACRTAGLQGRAKFWLQLPGRQLVLDERLSGDTPQWTDIEAVFTPGPGETWCHINLSLDGRGGTVWFDAVSFTRAPPAIATLRVPNDLRPQGACRLENWRTTPGLRLECELRGRAAQHPIASWTIPVDNVTEPLILPANVAGDAVAFIIRLVGPGGRIMDARQAGVFLAGTPFEAD